MSRKKYIADKNTVETVFVDTQPETVKSKNIKTLKIIDRYGGNKAVVNFEGYGLAVEVDDISAKTVTIEYEGTIGKKGFKYRVVK